MNKIFLSLPLLFSLLSAQTTKAKVFHAQDRSNAHHAHYNNSSHRESQEDAVLSSTAEVSSEITFSVSVQISTEATSEHGHEVATMSYLDNNRLQITEDMAKGEGEFLATLLEMVHIEESPLLIEKLQIQFDELIQLNHNDFLEKLMLLS